MQTWTEYTTLDKQILKLLLLFIFIDSPGNTLIRIVMWLFLFFFVCLACCFAHSNSVTFKCSSHSRSVYFFAMANVTSNIRFFEKVLFRWSFAHRKRFAYYFASWIGCLWLTETTWNFLRTKTNVQTETSHDSAASFSRSFSLSCTALALVLNICEYSFRFWFFFFLSFGCVCASFTFWYTATYYGIYPLRHTVPILTASEYKCDVQWS